MESAVIEIVPLAVIAPPEIEALLDRAFGRDRHARTAYRLRKGVDAIAALSFAAVEQGVLVGSVQCWPVLHLGDDGVRTPLVLLGPVAVEPARQQGGIGRVLTNAAIAAADATVPALPMMLIGDPEYYGRFFGFTAKSTAHWRLPGPVEARRLLARGDAPAMPGAIGPRVSVVATATLR